MDTDKQNKLVKSAKSFAGARIIILSTELQEYRDTITSDSGTMQFARISNKEDERNEALAAYKEQFGVPFDMANFVRFIEIQSGISIFIGIFAVYTSLLELANVAKRGRAQRSNINTPRNQSDFPPDNDKPDSIN